MTQPEGRAMKYGIIEQIIPGDFRGNNKKLQILSLKKICREGNPELCGGAQSSLGVNEKSSSRISR